MVEHDTHEMVVGMFIWDVREWIVFHSLHVVVWAKPWNSWGRTSKRMLVKFRPATPEEFAVETVMNE
jgi:hypothetical protein